MHGVGGGRGDVTDLKDPEPSENDPLTALLGCDADQVVALLLLPSLVLSIWRLGKLAPALSGEKTGVRALRNSV